MGERSFAQGVTLSGLSPLRRGAGPVGECTAHTRANNPEVETRYQSPMGRRIGEEVGKGRVAGTLFTQAS